MSTQSIELWEPAPEEFTPLTVGWHAALLKSIREVAGLGRMMLLSGKSGCGMTTALRRIIPKPLEQTHGRTIYLSLSGAPSAAAALCKLNEAIAPGTSPRDMRQHSEAELEDLVCKNIVCYGVRTLILDHAHAAPESIFECLRRIHGELRCGSHLCGIVIATNRSDAIIFGHLSSEGVSPVYLCLAVPRLNEAETGIVFKKLIGAAALRLEKLMLENKEAADEFLNELHRQTNGAFLTLGVVADRYRLHFADQDPSTATIGKIMAYTNPYSMK